MASGVRRCRAAGSGLAIANAIVTAHGGRIWIDDGAADGTAVVFEIPIEGTAMSLVLVVDDEPQIRRALRTSLEAHGYEVATVGTGEEGVVGAAEQNPDLLLLDLGVARHRRDRGDPAGPGVLRRAGHRALGARGPG